MQPISAAWLAFVALFAAIYRHLPASARAPALTLAGLGFAASHGAYTVAMAIGITTGAAAIAHALDGAALRSGSSPGAPPQPTSTAGAEGGRAEGGRARTRLLWLGLALLAGHLLAWKLFAGERPVGGDPARAGLLGYADVAAPAGLSYLTFKAIHVVIERYRGRTARVPATTLAAYLFFFPTLLAGPLGRVDAFRAELEAPAPLTMPVVNQALARILFGIAKKVWIADWLGRTLQPVLFAPQDHGRGMLLVAVYGVALQLYVDFSAASDVAIGAGRLLGFTVPENFDRPLLSPNIAAFWRSWHISLYTFIRDYVFFPIAGYKASRLTMYVGMFASIALFQVWHRVSWSFALLGLFHGSAVGIWQWVQERKRRSPQLRHLLDHRAALAPSIAMTVSVYAFGNILFMAPVDVAQRIYLRLFGP